MLRCYKHPKIAGEPQLALAKLAEALIYFDLPVKCWPVGAQLQQKSAQQQLRDDAVAAEVMSALKAMLQSQPDVDLFGCLRKRPSENLTEGAPTVFKTKQSFYVFKRRGLFGITFEFPSESYSLSDNQRASLEVAAAAELMQMHWSEEPNWASRKFDLSITL